MNSSGEPSHQEGTCVRRRVSRGFVSAQISSLKLHAGFWHTSIKQVPRLLEAFVFGVIVLWRSASTALSIALTGFGAPKKKKSKYRSTCDTSAAVVQVIFSCGKVTMFVEVRPIAGVPLPNETRLLLDEQTVSDVLVGGVRQRAKVGLIAPQTHRHTPSKW